MKVAPTLAVLAAAAMVSAACHDGLTAPDYGPATGNAASFGIWVPGPNDDCTQAQHDAYSVVGPDHKRYPTWHPPIDPVTGCSFGHDHGRDRDPWPIRAQLRRNHRGCGPRDASQLARRRRRAAHPRPHLR